MKTLYAVCLCLLGLTALTAAENRHLRTYRRVVGSKIKLSDLDKKTPQLKQEVKAKAEPEKPVEEKVIGELSWPETTKYISDLHTYIDTLHTYIDTINKPVAHTAGSISFAAVRTTDLGPVAQDTVIQYDQIDVNIGSHFDSSTSFLVPLDGLYYFSYQYAGANAMVNLMMKADEPTAGAIVQTSAIGGGTVTATGSGSLVMDLVVGNQVYLSLEADSGSGHIISDPAGQRIAFTGFMLYQRV